MACHDNCNRNNEDGQTRILDLGMHAFLMNSGGRENREIIQGMQHPEDKTRRQAINDASRSSGLWRRQVQANGEGHMNAMQIGWSSLVQTAIEAPCITR